MLGVMDTVAQKIAVTPHVESPPASISHWPTAAKRAARQVMARYGPPNEVTDSQMIWLYNSPWKRTVVYRSGTPHSVPHPHIDILAQTVEYRLPPQKIGELVQFNGSLTIDVTREELTAHCDSEATNCMILNLAHDIVIGRRTVPEAQAALRSMSGALRLNWPELYAQGLQFDWHDAVAETQRVR